MKRWVGRTFWLSAWSFWLWLGFGLHRELPRDLGPVVRTLPFDRMLDGTFGFVADSNSVAIIRRYTHGTDQRFEVYDAESGSLLSGTLGEMSTRLQYARRFGVLLLDRWSSEAKHSGGLKMLDLSKGGWRRISTESHFLPSAHPDLPRVAFVETSAERPIGMQLVVYDYRDDKRLFVRPCVDRPAIVGRPFFVPESEIIVVPTESTAELVQYELWNLRGVPRLEGTVSGPPVGEKLFVSSNRRVLFRLKGEEAFRVMSLDDGRIIFSYPHDGTGDIAKIDWRGVTLGISNDGSRVVGGAAWNIDARKEVWRPGLGDYSYPAHDGEHFHVLEQWKEVLKEWWPNFEFDCRTLRRLDTGIVVWRSAGTEVTHLGLWNTERTLGVTTDGRIYRLPLLVNYPLLALCQTILALPLVLLWAILRWRRNRRLRLAGMQS